jgi:sulfite reductase (NADPH) flavoprotein alpha-component
LHKKIWFKIHWILGITAGIVLLVVGISGATLSFEKEIIKFINKDTFVVSVPDEAKLSTKELLEKFQATNPKAKINSVSFSTDETASTIINIAGEGKEARRGINYYVNPYTAEVLPQIKGKEFFEFVLRLHRWLAFEGNMREVGKQIVAFSTVALIILAFSGVVVYWGRIKRAFFKSFTFSFKHHGRAFLSTMHSAVGMWVLPFYLLAALTGLYWSYDWYNAALYKIAGVEKPQRNMPAQMKNPQQRDNSQGQRGPRNKDNQRVDGEKIEQIPTSQNVATFDDYQKAVDLFNTTIQMNYYTASVKFPQKGTVYSFSYLIDKSDHFRESNTLEFDINSNEVLKHDKFEDKPLNEQLMRSILPLHTGEYFGIIGQIGMFLASSLMALFTITGFMLYINRHKKKKVKIIKE